MNKESLNKTLRMILLHLKDLGIDEVDKAELMINLYHFLDEEKYEENIKVLRKEQDKNYGIKRRNIKIID